MCAYTYTFTHIHYQWPLFYTNTSTHTHTYIHWHVHTHKQMQTHTQTQIHIHVQKHVHVHVLLRVRVGWGGEGGVERGRRGGSVGGWVDECVLVRMCVLCVLIPSAVSLRKNGAQQLYQVKRMIGGLGNVLFSTCSLTWNVFLSVNFSEARDNSSWAVLWSAELTASFPRSPTCVRPKNFRVWNQNVPVCTGGGDTCAHTVTFWIHTRRLFLRAKPRHTPHHTQHNTTPQRQKQTETDRERDDEKRKDKKREHETLKRRNEKMEEERQEETREDERGYLRQDKRRDKMQKKRGDHILKKRLRWFFPKKCFKWNPPDELVLNVSRKNPFRTNYSSIFLRKFRIWPCFQLFTWFEFDFSGRGNWVRDIFGAHRTHYFSWNI